MYLKFPDDYKLREKIYEPYMDGCHLMENTPVEAALAYRTNMIWLNDQFDDPVCESGYDIIEYTEKDLFEFMNSERPIMVVTKDNKILIGKCLAYSSAYNFKKYGISSPSIEVESDCVFQGDITRIFLLK